MKTLRQPSGFYSTSGFTLVELIMVMVLIGALTSVASIIIIGPMEGFVDQGRRAELVDIAETALQRMTREMRDALPNSVRTSNNGSRYAIEFLSTSTGGRYRSAGANRMKFNKDILTFDVLGEPPGAGLIDTAGGNGQANCMNNIVDCLVIYNTGTSATDFNAYNGDNIAAITAVTSAAPDNLLTMTFDNNDPTWSFPADSPSKRFFVVDTPISFVCDSATGELLMYQDYSISSVQPVAAGAFGVVGRVLADQVSNCDVTFQYKAGAGVRYGLVIIRLDITGAGTTETISLLQQVHVLNAP